MTKFQVAVCVALAAVAAVTSTSCGSSHPVEAKTLADADVPTVAVTRAEPADLSHSIVLTAEFKPYQEVDVMAKVAGFVKNIYVDIGDRVRDGQLLATLEVPEMRDDLHRAEAATESAQSDVTHAADEVARDKAAAQIAELYYKRLAAAAQQQPGLLAQQEIDDAQSKALEAEARVSAAESAVSEAREQVGVNQADVDKDRTLMDYTRVVAPFSGVITKRYADVGSMIQAATASETQAMPLVRISENQLLRLILPVPESAVPSVHVGQPVEVKVPTLHRSFPGRVVRFEDKLSLETRTMNTEVDVPNPGLVLIPGMYAEVDLTLQRRASVLAVPVTAVDVDSADSAAGRVMVVTPEGRIARRKVALGLETASEVEVRSGLAAGDLVVIGNRTALDSGEQVRPKFTQIGGAAS